jgi:tetratricopeptide (TPR) repeat protein/DNA-binding XRE family transcriptional regulator
VTTVSDRALEGNGVTREEPRDGAARLAARLAALRSAVGLNQGQLATRINYSRTTLVHAERGRQVPALVFWQLCDEELGANGELIELYESYRAMRAEGRPSARTPTPSLLYGQSGRSQGWVIPASLPNTVPDFVERADGVTEQVLELLGAGERSLTLAPTVIVIAGRAGIGKTALALHIAHRVRGEFHHGQLFADLKGLRSDPPSPADVIGGFLQQLGVPSSDLPVGEHERVALYRARMADRRVLVVCDNVADLAQIRPLMPTTPSSALIVTSRSRLRGLEVTYRADLELMRAPAARSFLSALAGETRVEAEPDDATAIVELCGYLPLALRAAGALLASRPLWSLSWFRTRLSDEHRRLSMLQVEDLDVRASFALSYEALILPAQDAFRTLGLVDARTFSPWMVAAMLERNTDESESLLDLLVEAQLVDADGPDECGFVRCGLHDLVRDYARELVAADITEGDNAALARLLDVSLIITSAAAGALGLLNTPCATPQTEGEYPGWLDADTIAAVTANPWAWFERERETLAALVEQAYGQRLDDRSWRLAETLQPFFQARADWQLWQSTHGFAWRAAARAGDRAGTAAIERGLGVLCHDLGRFADAEAHCLAAMRAFASLGRQSDVARVQCNLGDAHRYSGRLNEAVEAFEESLAVFDETTDEREIAAAKYRLGDTFRGLSRWQRSETNLRASRQIVEHLGDALHLARTDVRLAMLYRDQSLTRVAIPLCRQALPVFQALGDRRWEGRTLRQLALLARNEGDPVLALDYLDSARPIFHDLGDRRTLAVITRNEGDTYRYASDHDRALGILRSALDEFQEIGDPRWEARTWLGLADTHRAIGDYDAALDQARKGVALLAALKDVPGRARGARTVGLIQRDGGDVAAALDSLHESLTTYDQLGDTLWGARALGAIAGIHDHEGQDSTSLRSEVTARCRAAGCRDADEEKMWMREW